MGQFSERVSKAQSCIPEVELEIWSKLSPKMRTKSRIRGGGELCRPVTIKNYLNAYIAGTKFLMEMGWFDAAVPPEARWTFDKIEAFVSRLKPAGTAYASQTIINRLIGIYMFLTVIAPEGDHSALLAPLRRLERKNVREIIVVDPDDIIRRAVSVMQIAIDSMPVGWNDEILVPSIKTVTTRLAIQYRAGFQLAWITYITTRISNTTDTEFGKNKNLLGSDKENRSKSPEEQVWWLLYSRKVTKNRRAYDRQLPKELLPWLNIYLDKIRPILCVGKYRGVQSYDGDRLWISSRGRPQSQGSIRKNIKACTTVLIEGGLPPHRIRHSIATAIAKRDPANSSRASWQLTNDVDTMNFSYNKAGRAPARRLVIERLGQLAKQCKIKD